MTTPDILYPPSFSATASLSPTDCKRLDDLTPEQRSELETGRAYIYAINCPAAPRKSSHKPLPTDYRAKVAVYCQALMDRKMGHKNPTG